MEIFKNISYLFWLCWRVLRTAALKMGMRMLTHGAVGGLREVMWMKHLAWDVVVPGQVSHYGVLAALSAGDPSSPASSPL